MSKINKTGTFTFNLNMKPQQRAIIPCQKMT